MALCWDDRLIMGVPELDRQHQELFQHLDRLLEAVRRGRSRDEVRDTLSFLAAYVRGHFADEEALMRAIGFPQAARHTVEHAGFARDLAALEAELQRNGPTPSLVVRVNGWLRDWLHEHIGRADRELGAFFQTRAA